tara:strand:+ start:1134 stop:1451 length:318 start_codon:yes stop_codon:yes gene_type:complete
LSDEIKTILSDIFLKDLPTNKIGIVTITKVDVSSDLRTVKIGLSFLSNSIDENDAVSLINISKKPIRYKLGKRIQSKYVPDISFFYDDSLKKVDHIDRKIKDLKK